MFNPRTTRESTRTRATPPDEGDSTRPLPNRVRVESNRIEGTVESEDARRRSELAEERLPAARSEKRCGIAGDRGIGESVAAEEANERGAIICTRILPMDWRSWCLQPADAIFSFSFFFVYCTFYSAILLARFCFCFSFIWDKEKENGIMQKPR